MKTRYSTHLRSVVFGLGKVLSQGSLTLKISKAAACGSPSDLSLIDLEIILSAFGVSLDILLSATLPIYRMRTFGERTCENRLFTNAYGISVRIECAGGD
jgi:hypothetical protein